MRAFNETTAGIVRRTRTHLRRFLTNRSDHRIAKTLARYAGARTPIYLVQIGSNDGKTNDPFYDSIVKYDWFALLVEPVPFVFDRLVQNHLERPKVLTINAAISDAEGIKPFYHLKPAFGENVPWWYDQIGSFNRDQVLKSKNEIPNLEKLLTSTAVPCLSLPDLLESQDLTEFQILHTDLEGYDFEVLRQLDFSKWSPDLILYEHKHLPPSDAKACIEFLKENGYRLIEGSADTLAVKS